MHLTPSFFLSSLSLLLLGFQSALTDSQAYLPHRCIFHLSLCLLHSIFSLLPFQAQGQHEASRNLFVCYKKMEVREQQKSGFKRIKEEEIVSQGQLMCTQVCKFSSDCPWLSSRYLTLLIVYQKLLSQLHLDTSNNDMYIWYGKYTMAVFQLFIVYISKQSDELDLSSSFRWKWSVTLEAVKGFLL